MSDLLLMRHARSEWPPDVPDFDRPLKARGRRAAKRMGRWLKAQQLVPDVIISSPAARTFQTARICCTAADIPLPRISTEPALYLANTRTLLRILQAVRQPGKRIMLVGHNPGLDALLHTLVGTHLPLTPAGKLMTTANIAHLRINDEVTDRVVAEFVQLVRPLELQRLERNQA